MGEIAEPIRVRLSPATADEMRQAAKASGNLSHSLYFERIAELLRAEHGALPVFTDDEETHTAAA